MKWEPNKEALSKRQKKQPEVREVSPVDGCRCLWWKTETDCWKNVSNLEWKSEGVVDDDSGDNKGDEVKKID